MTEDTRKASSQSPSRFGLAELAVVVAGVTLLAGFVTLDNSARYPEPPDFGELDIDEKKRRFFSYLSPMISDVNFRLAAERDRVRELQMAVERGESIGWFDRRWLERLALRLEVDLEAVPLEEALDTLVRRTGVVPESIVLVQAAVESGWGTSRFALEGNNYFGQRCYSTDCGMTPEQQRAGESFGLAEYTSPAESVESYILNLNTHESYREFRQLRQRLRRAGEPLTGLALVEGLRNYSERGTEYVAQIADMIRSNDLE